MKIDNIDASYNPEFDGHKKIIRFQDSGVNLFGFIAIHNTNLGPAVGGTRFYSYSNKDEALTDVLRLSHAMTYKCAISGVKFGGGKAVIIGNPAKLKTKKTLKAYALVVRTLAGSFYTGEDVGISESNVQYMLKVSPYFVGKSSLAGDPSPFAALSTYISLKTAARYIYGKYKLKGLTIAVKGVGKVGSRFVELVLREGADVCIADIDKGAIKKVLDNYPQVTVVNPKDIHRLEVDIYSPCAMGSEFNKINIKTAKYKIICGAANNQLSSMEIGELLFKRNILYVPDYLANCGGLLNVVGELDKKGYKKETVVKKINNVSGLLKKILTTSKQQNVSPSTVANKIAEEIVNKSSYEHH